MIEIANHFTDKGNAFADCSPDDVQRAAECECRLACDVPCWDCVGAADCLRWHGSRLIECWKQAHMYSGAVADRVDKTITATFGPDSW
jgi:hypothetical protein